MATRMSGVHDARLGMRSPTQELRSQSRSSTAYEAGQRVHGGSRPQSLKGHTAPGVSRDSFSKPPPQVDTGSGGTRKTADVRSKSTSDAQDAKGTAKEPMKRSASLTRLSDGNNAPPSPENTRKRGGGWFGGGIQLEDILVHLNSAVQASLEQEGGNAQPRLGDKLFKLSYYFECEEGVTVQMFSPMVYKWIRGKCGIAPAQWGRSWQTNFSVHGSSGKSGASFARSGDGRFFLKSLTEGELRVMRDVAPDLLAHFNKHENSLINRPLGLYTATVKGNKFHFIAVANIFHPNAPLAVLYDLKGSTQGRAAKADEHKKSVPLLKDVDWQTAEKKIRVTKPTFDKLAAVIRSDCQFFTKNDLMDYSLFVGACKKTGLQGVGGSNLLVSGDTSYYIGIIDYLQVYNLGKKIAHAAKGVVNDVATISTIPPADYASRFERFMLDTVFAPPPTPVAVKTADSGGGPSKTRPLHVGMSKMVRKSSGTAATRSTTVGNGTFSHPSALHAQRGAGGVKASVSAEPASRNPLFNGLESSSKPAASAVRRVPAATRPVRKTTATPNGTPVKSTPVKSGAGAVKSTASARVGRASLRSKTAGAK